MSAAEIRSLAVAYHRIHDLLDQPLAAHQRETFTAWLSEAEGLCRTITHNSAPARWARSYVGPVLSAALGSAAYMREDIPHPGSALRVFGLTGERPLSGPAAWKLMQPYVWEPAICEKTLAELRRRTGLRLHRLPADPAPADVLIELTRPRSDPYCMLVARWLAEYFRAHPNDVNPYADLYRVSLSELHEQNARGEMALRSGEAATQGRLTREEWEGLIRGRLPDLRIEMRAAYAAVRHFIPDYWQQWRTTKTHLAAG